jgi:hypothetical protein
VVPHDANGRVLAHVYGEPPNAIATSPNRLTNNEARRISMLITRLPELVEFERDRNRARSRRKPQPLRFKPVTIGDLIRLGKLPEFTAAIAGPSVICTLRLEACRSARRCLRLRSTWSAARCGAPNSEI